MRVPLRFRRALALVGAIPILAGAQNQPTVAVVADLLKDFDPAQTQDCLECGVRPSSLAGGERRAGLFEHPKTPDKPARVAYDIQLPTIQSGELLLLAFDIAIADGAQLESGADGVRFIVAVDGQQMFSRDWKQNRWQPAALDLTSLAGRRIQLALLTDAIRNTSYDWALWGNPRILHFAGDVLPGSSRLNAGAIAVNIPTGEEAMVRLKPIGQGDPIVWHLPADTNSSGTDRWRVFDFMLPEADGVEVSWEPRAALDNERLRIGAYPAHPRLVRISPTQAVTQSGGHLEVSVEVKNDGRGRLAASVAQVRLHVGTNAASAELLPALDIPALPPGDTWNGRWSWVAPPAAGRLPIRAELSIAGDVAGRQFLTNSIVLFPSVRSAVLEDGDFHVEMFGLGTDANYARLFQGKERQPVGVWSPLMRVVVETAGGPVDWNVPLTLSERDSSPGTWILRAPDVKDPSGKLWDATLELRKEPKRPLFRIHGELTAKQDSEVRAFWGPNLYVGDGTTRNGKQWGLFPGLEFLFGPERSSNPRDFAPPLNDRRTPRPTQYTIPLMAVTAGEDSRKPPEKSGRFYSPDSAKDAPLLTTPARQSSREDSPSEFTVAIWWNPLQTWGGRRAYPSPRFASPNFDEGMENHRIGLFVPSVPDVVPENGDRAVKPIPLRTGEKLRLDATLMITAEPVLSAVREWIRDRGGLPMPNPWPRTFPEELDVCRAGFLKTLWDEKNEKWRHCIDWAASHAPGFAALLWMDSHVAGNADARTRSRERVEQAGANMLRDAGPAAFTSQANCHIMQWEFPFLYGCLPEALSSLDGQIRQLIQTQRPDGGWQYEPSNKEQADLGQAGDSVLGTCANRASTILRYARITGDASAQAAGVRALAYMERFRVPRGGQTWECPMYEPDILAAAYAIKACVDGYRITADQRWLHDAVYWAETGVPFVYLWSLPDKPMMLGATIPVFGSTFYTHSWLGTPVQWCGLVYSYHVGHLAEELERTPLKEAPSPLPLALEFSPSDWKRVVELITVSGMYQQFADGPKIGAYPDSISEFEKRNPAFINPEDILLNVLALKGHDPDVKTARLETGDGEIVVSSGAYVTNLKTTGSGAQFQLRFFQSESSHTLVVGMKPREVLVNGARLPESQNPVRREPGWWWDQQCRRLYLAVSHGETETTAVEITR